MFQFSGFALLQLVFNKLGFPIRKSTDQFIFANPRSLSQLITSFIASESQGIPRVPFLTFFYRAAFAQHSMPLCWLWVVNCQLWVNSLPSFRKITISVVFSFFNYFFQYVKELFASTLSHCDFRSTVENNGFEPLTPCVQGRCSSQLS